MQFLTLLDLRAGPGAALLRQVRHETSQQLAAVADRLGRVFIVNSPWAPGLCCIGAELALDQHAAAAYGTPRISVTGGGETPEEALTSCLGEAADRLAVVERSGDLLVTGSARPDRSVFAGTWVSTAMQSSAGEPDWIEARDALAAHPVSLPADLCLRRAPDRRRIEPAGPLSAGVAAGAGFASAAVRAGLELCERDAAALWWLGGRRPMAFPAEHPASAIGAKLVEKLRQGCTDRRTLLLDITTDLGIPTVAAISLGDDGRGLACGLAARLDAAEAARAALLEMCQMELAAPLAEAKRAERGDGALNHADRQHLRRAAFVASGCELIRPCGISDLDMTSAAADDDLAGFASRLAGRGVRLFVIDLTRQDIGVPVARMVSPDLQPYSSDVVSDRLQRCRAAHDGAHLAVTAIPLM